jgi:TRAP-type uncharacterized transport system fused permease subunit
MDGPWSEVLLVWEGAALGFICSAAVLEGYFIRILTWPDRGILSVASLLLFWNGIWFKLAGLALMAGSLMMQRSRPLEFPEIAPAAVEAEATEG